MDGVLVDSEKLYMDMNQALFRCLGAHVSIAEHQTFIGMSATKMWTHLKTKFSLHQSVDELKALEKELKYKMLQETELVPMPGVIAFLDYLKARHYSISIASSSLKKNVDLILEKTKITHYFDLVVSGEQVERGKPDPDIFLTVANHYDVHPASCVVIEDSMNGVLAAKSAGMICIGFRNANSGNQDLSKADVIINSFDDVRLFDAVEKQ